MLSNRRHAQKSLRLLSLALLLFAAFNVRAAEFTVNNNGDDPDANTADGVCATATNVCTLRAAVEQANALNSDDSIVFAANMTNAIITLTSGVQIPVAGVVAGGALTITGLGADRLTIDGGPGTNRIFSIGGTNVTIKGVTLQGGNAVGSPANIDGGAIYTAGPLTLDSVLIRNNTAPRNGGGVYYESSGPHRILNSTFTGNTAGDSCGAFFKDSSVLLTMANTTISGNSALNFGGGLCVSTQMTIIRNSTVTNNMLTGAGGGGGGIVSNGGDINLGNTIVAGNTSASFPEIYIFAGTGTSAGNNFVGDSAGDSASTGIAIAYQMSDIRDQNPLLSMLVNGGGPTPTHALLSGSPAINAGDNAKAVDPFNNARLLRDQRGFTARNTGGIVDIGAFEFNAAPPQQLKVSAFDGDSNSDVAIWNPTSHNWRLRESLTNNLRTQLDWGNGALGDIAVPRDYDGDGKTDIAVYRPSEGNWYIIQSSTNTIRLVNWGNASDKPVPADYDGDLRVDIAVFRPAEGNWYIINSQTNTVTVRGWGTSSDLLVPGDYDGDRRADLAVFRPSEGNWYIIYSSFNIAVVTNWGVGTDRPVPADFDGDGYTDIAIYRPGEGTWYIRNSAGGVTAKQWGQASDVLVPADYDGDKRVDIAVYRPAEGNWYILQSMTNSARTENIWSGADDVPAPSTYIPQ